MTATVTDPAGNTSEFSQAYGVDIAADGRDRLHDNHRQCGRSGSVRRPGID